MIVLGIDPGKTTGWATYCTDDRRVLASGTFPGASVSWQNEITQCDEIVIEKPRVFPGSPPPIGDACIDAGVLWHMLLTLSRRAPHWLYMSTVRSRLSAATHGEVCAKTDATVTAALRVIHGDGSDKRPKIKKGQIVEQGGPIWVRNSHERDALAAAWAFANGGAEC